MTKDNWINSKEWKDIKSAILSTHIGLVADDVEELITKVEKDAIEKTNKRWRLRVNKAIGKKEAKGKITGDWLNDVLECCKGERNLFRFNIREKLSDLLEDKHEV